MNKLNQYDIAFVELTPGSYEIDFDLTQLLFEEYDSQSQGIYGGTGAVHVLLEKGIGGMQLKFHIDAQIEVECDVCLDTFLYHVDHREELTVRFAEESDDQQGEIILLSVHEDVLNVSQFIYEYINYGLPFRRIHPKVAKGVSGCNPEMLEKISQHLVSDEETANDPRWDALRKLGEN
ncbi:MAG: hypothetical protein RIS47_762 [Bacteroidota bacterium]